MTKENQLTRRDFLKGTSKLIGIVGFVTSAGITMDGAFNMDVQGANYKLGKILKKPESNYRFKGGLFSGLVSTLLIYYGTRR